MTNNIVELIKMLESYRTEEDENKVAEMHTVLVRSLIKKEEPKVKRFNSGESVSVTFSMDDNLHELFIELADSQKDSSWKRKFLNKASLNQAMKEIKGEKFEQHDELMVVEPSFKDVLTLLDEYKNESDVNKLNVYHEDLIRLLLEHRVMNTEGTTVAAISTQVGFQMEKDLFDLFDNMASTRETGWKRNFLNRAVFNEIIKIINVNKYVE